MTETIPDISIANTIAEVIKGIKAFDDLEQQHIQETLIWIRSGTPIFRTKKPDIPNKHLVSYFVLFDEKTKKILLVDHKKAELWLPPGGHVEVGEHPRNTVIRECIEELQCKAEFWSEKPIFLTATVTVGLTAGHTDVSLWYVLKGNCNQLYQFDSDEFNTIQWFGFEAIPFEKSDRHMRRFVNKLSTLE